MEDRHDFLLLRVHGNIVDEKGKNVADSLDSFQMNS